jgi:hypothetical protein
VTAIKVHSMRTAGRARLLLLAVVAAAFGATGPLRHAMPPSQLVPPPRARLPIRGAARPQPPQQQQQAVGVSSARLAMLLLLLLVVAEAAGARQQRTALS